MKYHKRLMFLAIPVVLLMSISAIPAAAAELSADSVRAAFTAMVNEEGRPYDPQPGSIVFLPGSFTAPGAREAVVYFVDNNQSHAAGAAELWLCRYDGAVTPVIMIDQSDEIEARLIDAGGKGIFAVMLSASHFSTGGFITSHWTLVSLYGGLPKTIHNAAGNDFAFYTMYKQVGGKDRIVTHQIGFRDNYGDSPAELIDTELSGAFVHTGKGDSGYEVLWTSTAVTTYRLVVDKDGVLTGAEKVK